MAIRSETRTVHTVHVDLPDDVLGRIEFGDEVEVQFHSRAQNRLPAPVRLSYTALNRLLRDA
jgi:hypothetical protein